MYLALGWDDCLEGEPARWRRGGIAQRYLSLLIA